MTMVALRPSIGANSVMGKHADAGSAAVVRLRQPESLATAAPTRSSVAVNAMRTCRAPAGP